MRRELFVELLGDATITIVDGGARNDTLELPGLARHVRAYSFEPNPAEYEKLVEERTDRYRGTGVARPPYRELRYIPAALHDRVGEAALFVTAGPGACSLLEPNRDLIRRCSYFHPYPKKFWPQFEVQEIRQVSVTTLDRVSADFGIGHIDYLKLDTQGNEYEILQGAHELLSQSRIGVVKCEVEFIELYNGQKLFHDVDGLLRGHGFGLVDLMIDDLNRIMLTPERFPGELGVLFSGDAIYARNEAGAAGDVVEAGRLVRRGLILAELGYVSLGADLICRNSGTPLEAVSELFRRPELTGAVASLKRAVRQITPPIAYLAMSKGRRRFSRWRAIQRTLRSRGTVNN